MNSLLLTIVIPVYNVSQYVEKCVRSCYKQNVSNSKFEIIIINDGSTDDSLEICEKLKKEYRELKIISQKNKGLSGARNTGLRNANGKYVWFVDSDDWIEEDCLTVLFEQLKWHDVDLFWMGHDVIYKGISNRKYIPNKMDNPITGEELFVKHLNNLFYIWKFIFKKEFLINNNLEFYEGILYEDLEFTPRALLTAKSCYTIPHSFYNYLMRSGSIINNISTRNIEHRFFILNRLNQFEATNKRTSQAYKNKLIDIIIETFVGTVKMAARSKILLPASGFKLLEDIKNIKTNASTRNLHFRLIKLNLLVYYKAYKYMYASYSKFKY